ncbi:hypothetical protein Hte_003618 [Hypoxylon texense]
MGSIKEKTTESGLPAAVDYEQGQTQLGTAHDVQNLTILGYKPELRRNRSMFTLLFQSLAIAAIPYGFGGPLISAIYGGGQLPMFLGWIVVLILSECIALSLSELASRYPTSAGPYYWSFQLASPRFRTGLSFITGWTWLIGNWTITLSVNFGFASMLAAAISLFEPDFAIEPWQLLLIFYALCVLTFFLVAFGNKLLPMVDTICAVFTAISILVTCICVSVKADVGRHSPSYTLIIPLCATLPDLSEILGAPVGQALPYIFGRVIGSPGGGLALTILVLIITLFCSISITVAASRTTWAFARDNAIPLAHLWAKIDERHGTPIWALVLTTLIEMLLGLINLGSSSAFLAFVSVGVISLAVSYAIPITISLFHGRREVNSARWTMGRYLGLVVNLLALAWIAFEVVLFSMPTALPVTEVSMNYAIVVFVGFMVLSAIWYAVYARKVYVGPPESDGLTFDS